MGSKERRQEFTLVLPAAGKIPRSLREKMNLQASHRRGREGAARKRTLMKGPSFVSTRMSPQPLNAGNDAVNFELRLEDITDSVGVDPEVIDIFISEQEGQRQFIPPEISPRGLRFRENFS